MGAMENHTESNSSSMEWDDWRQVIKRRLLTIFSLLSFVRASVSSQHWLASSMINNPTLMSALSWLMDPLYRLVLRNLVLSF